mgnify:FL=1
MRKIYDGLMMASMAYARWDYETSMNIIKNRKKVLILLLLALPVLIPTLAWAGGNALPTLLGGKAAYAPAYYSPEVFFISIIVGLCAGLITGCIGAGGGFILTPALMSVGVRGILAVGTDLFHIFAKAIMGTTVHKKLGNVSVGLAVAFVAGSLLGVVGGGAIQRAIYAADPMLSDTFISIVYTLLLGFLGTYAMTDFLKSRKGPAKGSGGDAHGGPTGMTNLAVKLQSVNIPPMIAFDHDLTPGGRKISGWIVAFGGAIVGFVAAILGVGGGFITFPMFIYAFGVSSFTTVGTDILQIIFTAGFASITQYAIYGYVFYTLAMGLLLGSLLGIQVGAVTTKVVKGVYIRGFYAVTILAGFINRLFALPKYLREMEYITWSKELCAALDKAGYYVFFVIIGIFSLWVINTFIRNLGTLRAEAVQQAQGGAVSG